MNAGCQWEERGYEARAGYGSIAARERGDGVGGFIRDQCHVLWTRPVILCLSSLKS